MRQERRKKCARSAGVASIRRRSGALDERLRLSVHLIPAQKLPHQADRVSPQEKDRDTIMRTAAPIFV